MGSILDAISGDARAVIESALAQRDPELLCLLQRCERPTIQQSDALIDVLSEALSDNYGPGHILNERGRAIDNAIGVYLSAWPLDRRGPA